MAQVLTVRLVVKDDGSVVLERAAKGVDKLGKEADEAAKATGRLGSQLSSVTSLVGTFVSVFALKEIAGGMLALVRHGMDFNGVMQTSRLGIAALVSGMGEIRNAGGQVIQGQERWNAALGIASSMQERLKVAALQTTANYKDLVRVLQEGLGPMLMANISDPEKIIKFTQRIAQTGGALGIAGDRLGQEIRALLQGERGPDNQIANALLGSVSKAEFDRMRQAGELFDFLMDKMSAFALAGEEAGNTITGAMSNLRDAFDQAVGLATQDSVAGLTAVIKELTGEIVTFDEQGRATFNQEFVAGIRAVADAIGYLAKQGVGAVENLSRFIDFFGAYKDTVAQQTIGDSAATSLVQSFLPGVGVYMTYEARMEQFEQNLMRRRQERGQRNQAQTGRLDPQRRMQQEVEQYGDVISPDLKELMGGGPTLSGKNTGPSEKLRKEAEAFLKEIEKIDSMLGAKADPVASALRKWEKERAELLGSAKTGEQRAKINQYYDELTDDLFASVEEGFERAAAKGGVGNAIVKNFETGLLQVQKVASDIGQRIEDQRIAAIEDSIERERQLRIAEIEDWYRKNKAFLDQAKKDGANVSAELAGLEGQRQREIDQADADAARKRNQRIVGTIEFWKKLGDEVKKQFRSIDEIVTDSVLGNRDILAGSINGFLDDLVSGQADVMESLEGLGADLAKVWTSNFTDILMNGKNVTEQLKQLFRPVKNADGSTDMFGTALQGAGIGGAIGGMFQKPGNYAGVGGTVGGAIGAVIGAYFAAPAVGAFIGSAIGTAVGSMIQKGKDSIRVAIEDGIATVTETGISAEARQDLETQIKRRVKDEIKGFESIIDLFPEHMREQLRTQINKLNLSGGVENADITDEGALDTLSDFLGNKLPKAAFTAYQRGITLGIRQLGANQERLDQLLEYWGTLTGKELQDAVRRYIVTTLGAIEMRDLMSAPFHTRLGEAQKRASATPLTQLRDLDGEIANIVASASKLTDIEDIISAQERVNDLSRQRFEMEIAYLMQIDAIQQSIHSMVFGTAEQIELAGKDDQGKLDYYYQRLTQLRYELDRATDPQEIQRIATQMNSYIQSAFGLAPDNAQNRDQLLKILADIDAISGGQLDKARNEVRDADLKAAQTLQQAADALLKAAENLGPKPDEPEEPAGGGGGDGGKGTGVVEFPPEFPLKVGEAAAQGVREGLEGMMFAVDIGPIDITFEEGRLVGHTVDATIKILKKNPDLLSPRT